MKHEWIDRYIYAVVRHLPPKLRADVEKELASLISDMLEARCGAVQPTEKDVRVVLTELGSPEELAAKYSGDEAKALISGSYFLYYKLVLKIVLPIAAAGLTLATIIGLITDWNPEPNPYLFVGKIMAQLFAGMIGGTIQAFAFITVIFAILERKKVSFNDSDFIARLQPVPKMDERIKPREAIAGMVFCAIAAALFLGFPQIIGGWFSDTGWVPALDTQAIRSFWLPILLWAALGIAKEIVKLIDGRYTRRLAIVTAGANLLTAASALVVFLQGKIVNPEFLEHLRPFFAGEGEAFILKVLENFHLAFLGLVLFALVLETVTVAVKAWKHLEKE